MAVRTVAASHSGRCDPENYDKWGKRVGAMLTWRVPRRGKGVPRVFCNGWHSPKMGLQRNIEHWRAHRRPRGDRDHEFALSPPQLFQPPQSYRGLLGYQKQVLLAKRHFTPQASARWLLASTSLWRAIAADAVIHSAASSETQGGHCLAASHLRCASIRSTTTYITHLLQKYLT